MIAEAADEVLQAQVLKAQARAKESIEVESGSQEVA